MGILDWLPLWPKQGTPPVSHDSPNTGPIDRGQTPDDPRFGRSGQQWSKYQSGNPPGDYYNPNGIDWGDVERSQQNFYDTQGSAMRYAQAVRERDDNLQAQYNAQYNDFMAHNPIAINAGLDKTARNRMLDRARGDTNAQSQLFDARGTNLQSQYDIANRRADLELKGMGIDQAQAQAELEALGPLRGLAADILHNQSSVAANQIRGFNNQILGSQLEDRDRRRGIESSSVAAGTFYAPGQREDLRSSHQRLERETEAANAGIERANLGYEEAKLGYQGKLLDLTSRQQEIRTRQQKLGLIADQVGIDRDQAREALEFGMKQLGYDRYISANDLLDKIDSTSVAERSAANEAWVKSLEMWQVLQKGYAGDAYLEQTGG